MFEQLNPGMRGHDTKGRSPEELANILQQLGANHVQLALKKSFPQVAWQPSALTPTLGASMQKALTNKNCRVSILGCYINPVHPDPKQRREELEWFKANLKFAKYLGAGMVGTETGFYLTQEETHSEENYNRLLTSMRELADCAEALGTVIGVEPVTVHTLWGPERMRRFLEDIDSPNITVIYDPVNIADSNDKEAQRQMMDDMYRLCGERISVLHLKDYRIEDGKTNFLLAGDGVLDFPYLFQHVLRHTPCIDAVFEANTEETFPATRTKIMALWEQAVQEFRAATQR